jgi:hypothetical protein
LFNSVIIGVNIMLDFLKGKKTYIMAALMLAVNAAYQMGYIDKNTHDALMQLLGAGAVATVAAKMNRIDNKVQ